MVLCRSCKVGNPRAELQPYEYTWINTEIAKHTILFCILPKPLEVNFSVQIHMRLIRLSEYNQEPILTLPLVWR